MTLVTGYHLAEKRSPRPINKASAHDVCQLCRVAMGDDRVARIVGKEAHLAVTMSGRQLKWVNSTLGFYKGVTRVSGGCC